MALNRNAKKWVTFILLLIFVFFATDGFNKVGWNSNLARHVMISFYIGILILTLLQGPKLLRVKMPMRNYVIALAVIPFLCIITRTNAGDMSIGTFTPYLSSLTFLVYFILYEFEISERILTSSLLKIAIIIFVIQVVQQLAPSSAIFGVSDPNGYFYNGEMAEIRNGLYRYRIVCFVISLFAFYHSWQKVNERRNIKNVLVFIALAISVYLYLTRQLMFTSILTISCSFLFVKKSKGQFFLILTVAIFLLIIYQYSDVLFGELLTQTKDEKTTDNIRMLSLAFYWDRITEDAFSFFLGNGIHPLLQYWGRTFYFWPTDVGVIGAWFFYGVFWIITYIILVWNILIVHKNKVPLYVKLLTFGTFVNCFMIFPYSKVYEYIVWAIIIYICDLHISCNKKLIE